MGDARGCCLGQKVAHVISILPMSTGHRAATSCKVVLVMESIVPLSNYINTEMEKLFG